MPNIFPKYNPQRKTGDRGVTLVKSIIENQFGWIFRPTHLEDDFGIDGYFDIIGADNSVTGKYLGVQIKTGDSYFLKEISFGWKFVGENKHLNYFLNLNFPILIILVDLQFQKAYWTEFDINKTEKTTNGWSIIIPKESFLDSNAKSQIHKLTGDVIDYMSQIEYQWEINKTIKESSIIYLNVSKDEILNKDVRGFTELLKKLTIDEEMIAKTKNKLTFLIDGYNEDKREIYEIKEVREWVKIVIPAFKYWGYFLKMDEEIAKVAGLSFLQFCYLDIKIISRNHQKKTVDISADSSEIAQLMGQLFVWLNEFSVKYSIPDEVNEEQSGLIAKILLGDHLNK